MGLLLLLIGALAAGDGALAWWRSGRGGRRPATIVVVELLVGSSTIVASGVGAARLRPLAWGMVVLAGVTILVSVVTRLRRASREYDRRRSSEGARLKRYLEPPLR